MIDLSLDILVQNRTGNFNTLLRISCHHIRRTNIYLLSASCTKAENARMLQRDGTYQKREQTEPFVDSQAVFMEEALQNSRKPAEPKKAGFMEKIKDLFKR